MPAIFQQELFISLHLVTLVVCEVFVCLSVVVGEVLHTADTFAEVNAWLGAPVSAAREDLLEEISTEGHVNPWVHTAVQTGQQQANHKDTV